MSNIDKILEEINKKYNKGSIMKIGESIHDVDVISTSSKQLDDALGVGGLPKGRIIEIYGKEGGWENYIGRTCCS